MSNASGVKDSIFFRLYIIMDTIVACNAFTTSACWDTLDPILPAAAPLVTAISITIAAREPE